MMAGNHLNILSQRAGSGRVSLKKRKLILLAFLLSLITVVLIQAKKSATKPLKASYWHKMADGMSNALIEKFWGASFEGDETRYYFNYGSNRSDMSTEHFWPQAHAMDVMLDAAMRTGKRRYKAIMPLWWQGMPRYNPYGRSEEPWWNAYVDDMEWMVLALIRLHEYTGEKQYLEKARTLYDKWIWSTWGPDDKAPWYGGITWKTDIVPSKNACSNGPAAIIAARLYRLTDGDTEEKKRYEYLAESMRIYAWLKERLFDKESGAVYDHINAKGEVVRWNFTYNQGTFIGAAHELYDLTGDDTYLHDALMAADHVIERMSDNRGVLGNAKSGDGALFHGIFFRYFVKLTNDERVDENIRRKYHSYLTQLATTMATNGVNHSTMLYGGEWWRAPGNNENVQLTAQLTGCMLMEAMCILKKVKGGSIN